MIDGRTLDTIIGLLPPEYAAMLSEALETPEQKRARLLDARDRTIRDALALLTARGARNRATAAAELERRLLQHLAAADWKGDQHQRALLDTTDPLRALLQHVLALNGGRARGLGQVQLARIGKGVRTPETLS